MTLNVLDAAALQQPLGSVLDPANAHVMRQQPEHGQLSSLNITADATVKAAAGRSFKVSVIVAGSAAGALHDCATTGAAAAANQVGVIPNTVGVYDFNWPHATGIVIKIGTGQTLAISYS
jgi:hypothetical protein